MARPVLVFNAVPHVVVAVARSLGRRGIPVTFVNVDGSARPPASRSIHDFLQLPGHRDGPEEFIDGLVRAIESQGPRHAYPLQRSWFSGDPGALRSPFLLAPYRLPAAGDRATRSGQGPDH